MKSLISKQPKSALRASFIMAALCLAPAFIIAPASSPVMAKEMKHGHHDKMSTKTMTAPIISTPWARSSLVNGGNSAAYFKVMNHAKADDKIIDAKADVSKRVEIHTHIHDNGVMRMRRVKGGVDIKAGSEVMFKPGGYHIMLIGLKAKLVEGQKFPLTLIFEKAGAQQITVEVKKTDPTKSHGAHKKHH